MSKDDNKIEETTTQEETATVIEYDMEALKSKADLLGIKYSGNIGGKKLKEKIDLHLVSMSDEETEGVTESKVGAVSVGPSKKILTAEQKARQLVRVIFTDNDVSDADNPTIVHGVLNAKFKVGPVIIRKEEEQDVPFCIVEALKGKTMVKWVNAINTITKRPTGNKIPTTKKRYSIEYIK